MLPPSATSRWHVDMSVEERRAEIMRSLAGVLRERDLSTLTMQDIADRLGMAKGNLYNYFKSKQDLLYRCHIKGMEDSSRILENAREAGESAAAQIRVLMVGLVKSVIEDPYGAVLTTSLESLSPQQRRHYVSLRDRFERGVREILQCGVDSGEFKIADVKLAGFALLGSVNWVSRWYAPDGKKSAEEIGLFFADLFLRGLHAPA